MISTYPNRDGLPENNRNSGNKNFHLNEFTFPDVNIWTMTIYPKRADKYHSLQIAGALIFGKLEEMLRNKIFTPIPDPLFRMRGKEILRIEALSDAVFAFSVSLLVASLEVPQTFHELKLITQGAIPFFLTVALIFLFWYRQYIFFRRYGLNDFPTILLNLVYLAVILFYIYPLKFLFSLLIYTWSGIKLFPEAIENGKVILMNEEFPQLIMLFSTGYFLIWFIIYLMHQHILRKKDFFQFSKYEMIFTQKESRGALWNAMIGLLALLFAGFGLSMIAGICYLFIPVVLFINEKTFSNHYSKKG